MKNINKIKEIKSNRAISHLSYLLNVLREQNYMIYLYIRVTRKKKKNSIEEKKRREK